jgi:YHS domain-containing protein
MGWILRIILILIILRILWRMIMGPMRRSFLGRRKPGSMPLVRDPVCGTYLLPERAVKTGAGDGILYFCSETCRDKYHDGVKP